MIILLSKTIIKLYDLLTVEHSIFIRKHPSVYLQLGLCNKRCYVQMERSLTIQRR